LAAFLPHNSLLASLRKKRGNPGRKSETLVDFNIDIIMCLDHMYGMYPPLSRKGSSMGMKERAGSKWERF
jgi:hypothetical protein